MYIFVQFIAYVFDACEYKSDMVTFIPLHVIHNIDENP